MNSHDDDIRDVLDQLELLTPKGVDAPRPARQALAQFKQQLGQEMPHQPWYWRFTDMFKQRKYAFATAMVMFLIVLFAFPGVRAAASDFLGLFRVQKFAPISVSPQQLAMLEQIAEQGLVPGELEMIDEPTEPQKVESLDAAAASAGFFPRSFADLGQPENIMVMQGGSGRLTVNLANARAILEAAGIDPLLLPDSLDGQPVDATLYASVDQSWADGTMLMQTPSPQIDYPDDVDPTVLGEALLQILGLSPEEAHAMAQEIDWTSTLVVPVPQTAFTFSEVRVDGTSGMALTSIQDGQSGLVWQKDGVVYFLTAPGSTEDLLKLADSLK
jgi:hypothetical protein